jgi:hypothetical protein
MSELGRFYSRLDHCLQAAHVVDKKHGKVFRPLIRAYFTKSLRLFDRRKKYFLYLT